MMMWNHNPLFLGTLCLVVFGVVACHATSSKATSNSSPPTPSTASTGVSFNNTFSDYAVLQRAPAKAALYGMAGTPANGSTYSQQRITITLAPQSSSIPTSNNNETTTITGAALSAATVVQAQVAADGTWIAYLPPMQATTTFSVKRGEEEVGNTAGSTIVSNEYVVTALCTAGCANTTAARLLHVTVGDVYYCSGQSNMWLPLKYTYSRNYTVRNITSGAYDNIRLMAGDSQHAVAYPWKTARLAIADGNETVPSYSLFDFSAACWYFAESLTNQLKKEGKEVPVIGLISTAIGGSMIEEWMPNSTIAGCKNLSLAPHNQMLYDKNVRPYLKMTLKGFLWYQGENDMHGVKGSVIDHTGYACAMPALVKQWRQEWSKVPDTTSPQAYFGIVQIPPSGTEGGPNLGAMNIAQTGSYGTLPNPVMPNTFMAATFDLNDPWGDKTCYGWACCWNNYNESRCSSNAAKSGLPPNVCDNYCQQLMDTPVFMGGIHPRSKYLVGRRLAVAAASQIYGVNGPVSGPVIAGCSADSTSVRVRFDTTLLGHDSVAVRPYNMTAGVSGAAVLTNASLYCSESFLRCKINATGVRPTRCGSPDQEWYCGRVDQELSELQASLSSIPFVTNEMVATHLQLASGLRGVPPRNPFETAWVVVNISQGTDPAEIIFDTSFLDGKAVAGVRYAYNMARQCCDDGDKRLGKEFGCRLEACPIMSLHTNLPANPFMARISGGKCHCTAPQVCQ